MTMRTSHPLVRSLPSADPLSMPTLMHELTHTYMIWDPFVAGARRVDLHPLVLPKAMHDAAVRAAEDVTRAVGRVAALAHDDAVERALYRRSPEVQLLAAASHASGDDAALVRVDLLLQEDGDFVACEVNADCPGGHNEALGLPRLARAAGFTKGYNPTTVVDELVARLAELADGGVVALIFATAYAEDLQVCALLQRALAARGVRAIRAPSTSPRLVDGELRVGRTPVRVLYRYFPTEYMQGQKNVEGIAEAVASGRVRSLTSFSHIYEQSKYAFARAWHHAPTLVAEDRDVILRHLPRTYDIRDIAREELKADRDGWVLKRAYGRVGDEVFVGTLVPKESWGSLVDRVCLLCDAGESWIAQRFVRQQTVPTPWGPRYVTLGAYVLDGRFAGYFARLTPQSHVSHDALCVPVFHQDATEE
jgi:glutathionylspermidine synthase